MSSVNIIVKSKCYKTFRVKQLESIFDIPMKDTIQHSWTIDTTFLDGNWNIGLIVGPSGSGKTTIAKKLLSRSYHKRWTYNRKSIIDNISEKHSIQKIIEVFSSVGFSSPPSWLKSYHVLSNGERFRVDLARCILDADKLFVFDEFSSVVDRDVAKVCSYAVSKAVKKYKRKMIALSCHYDIIHWLEPDWVYDLRDYTLKRRRLRRPKIKLSIREVSREGWSMFKQHHYLTSKISTSAKCFGAYWKSQLVGFCAVIQKVGFKNCKRIHRLVVLPDYQGIGIGFNLLNEVSRYYSTIGKKMYISSSHPSVIKGLNCKKNWRLSNFYKFGTALHSGLNFKGRPSHILATYEYISEAEDSHRKEVAAND